MYGTLKQGCRNHHQLAGQTFIAAARTVRGFRLYDLGEYPGLVRVPTDSPGVIGEIWSVDAAALRRLDRFEGVHQGLYRREQISLEPPFADQPIDAYIYERALGDAAEIGSEWKE